MKVLILLCLLFLFTGCCTPRSVPYQEQYAHLKMSSDCEAPVSQSPFFIVFLVNAPHLDYSDNKSFLRTMAKHPDTGCKEGNVGHAWIYLHGLVEGECRVIEGGHSGERGICQPRYFEGIIRNVEEGCENPISYLWEPQRDGFFQEGNGGHRPTYAAKINLTEKQYWKVVRFIQHYPYCEYALIGNQCASFVAQIGELVDFEIDCKQTVQLESTLQLKNECLLLWTDPVYGEISVFTPDVVEKSLMLAVREGRAESVVKWYTTKFAKTFKGRNCLLMPSQVGRYLYFCGN